MKAQPTGHFRRHMTVLSGLILLILCNWQAGCKQQPRVTGPSYTCKDREIKVDAGASNGVDHDTVVICGGQNLSWKEKNNEKWKVEFSTSPFQGGQTTLQNGDGAYPVSHQNDDTAFKYAITVNGTKHDPQIIIMGGT